MTWTDVHWYVNVHNYIGSNRLCPNLTGYCHISYDNMSYEIWQVFHRQEILSLKMGASKFCQVIHNANGYKWPMVMIMNHQSSMNYLDEGKDNYAGNMDFHKCKSKLVIRTSFQQFSQISWKLKTYCNSETDTLELTCITSLFPPLI